MSLLEWRDEFHIGIAEVDHEHREMIELINGLHEEALRGDSAEKIATALGEINVRIAAHFALEEKNMEQFRYAGYPAHKADHEQLLDEIAGIMDEVYETGRYQAAALSARMSAWFGQHFRTHDARLHRWLGER
jgi:hemerythrin-like metal-binding protein